MLGIQIEITLNHHSVSGWGNGPWRRKLHIYNWNPKKHFYGHWKEEKQIYPESIRHTGGEWRVRQPYSEITGWIFWTVNRATKGPHFTVWQMDVTDKTPGILESLSEAFHDSDDSEGLMTAVEKEQMKVKRAAIRQSEGREWVSGWVAADSESSMCFSRSFSWSSQIVWLFYRHITCIGIMFDTDTAT